MPPVTVTYTEPDEIDAHGHKQKGKTKTVVNQVINFGDDANDAKGHFQTLTSPVPEASTSALLLAGLAGLAAKGLRRRRQQQPNLNPSA
jgi:MYXO-CTERM domain-containing protein